MVNFMPNVTTQTAGAVWNKFAGIDKKLSSDELSDLLKNCTDLGCLKRAAAKPLIMKFLDKDKDGLISDTDINKALKENGYKCTFKGLQNCTVEELNNKFL